MATADVTPDTFHARRIVSRLLRQLDHAMFMTQEAEQDVKESQARLLKLSESAKVSGVDWESAKEATARKVRLVRKRRTAMLKLRSQAIDLAQLRLSGDDELYRQAYHANQRVLSYALQLERHGY